MEQLKLCIIGVGNRGMRHAETALLLNDRYRLVAVCDVDERRVKEVSTQLGISGYSDIEEMTEKEQPDVAVIAVEAEGHHVIARFLAEKKVHIITETPISITLPCADAMIEAARANGVLLEVSENVIRWPEERVKQQIVSSGMIGDVKRFYVSYASGSYHGIAAIRAIIGKEAVEVRGDFPTDANIRERAEMSFEGGITGVYENNAEKRNYWEIIGEKGAIKGNELHIFAAGHKYRIVTEHTRGTEAATLKRAFVATEPEISFDNPYQQYPLAGKDDVARADVLIGMYEAVVNGAALPYGAENARKDIELLIAIRESAWRANPVKLPLRAVTNHERLIDAQFRKVYGVGLGEMSPEHLKRLFTLPGNLRSLLYTGRPAYATQM